MKEKVTLAKRPLKDGVFSLFLDYRIGGHRRRDNLKMYILPERTAIDRAKNAETMRVANSVRDRKEFELEQIEAGVRVKASPRMVLFSEFSLKYLEQYKKETTYANYRATIGKINARFPRLYVQEIDEMFFSRFIATLEKEGNRPNTIRKQCDRIYSVLKAARYDGLIATLPRIKKLMPTPEPSIVEYLTMDELRRLDATPCRHEVTKNAFLFCCFTGLRLSDCAALRSTMITNGEIVLRQVKTKEPVRIPLMDNALKYLPKVPKGNLYFPITSVTSVNQQLKAWGRAAGIAKNIHFHVSRHTFATLALSSGADLYTVSKLCGHTSVLTTQRYAKVVDEARRKAIEAVPSITVDEPRE